MGKGSEEREVDGEGECMVIYLSCNEFSVGEFYISEEILLWK